MNHDRFRITTLDQRVVRRITGEAEQGVLVSGPAAGVHQVVRMLRTFFQRGERDEELVGVLIRDVEPALMGPEHIRQLHLQAEARQAFLTQVPLLTSEEVGSLLGSAAKNRSAMASRLKRERKLFAVAHRGADHFPAFQIVEGAPHPAIERVLEAFEGESPWTVALWFDAPSGWLGGARPMDRLRAEPDRVVAAAERTVAPLGG
jgi:hypothetical protein